MSVKSTWRIWVHSSHKDTTTDYIITTKQLYAANVCHFVAVTLQGNVKFRYIKRAKSSFGRNEPVTITQNRANKFMALLGVHRPNLSTTCDAFVNQNKTCMSMIWRGRMFPWAFCTLFADDLFNWLNLKQMQITINRELLNISNWSEANKLIPCIRKNSLHDIHQKETDWYWYYFINKWGANIWSPTE